jgi:hypothetical protein
MMQPAGEPGHARCDEHPAELFTSPAAAAEHLATEHPDHWALLGTVEVEIVSGRAARRRAARQAARSQRLPRRRR